MKWHQVWQFSMFNHGNGHTKAHCLHRFGEIKMTDFVKWTIIQLTFAMSVYTSETEQSGIQQCTLDSDIFFISIRRLHSEIPTTK